MGTIMKTDSDNYNDIADAIREKSSSSGAYLPSEMGDAIRAIPQEGGGGIGEDVIADEYDNTNTYSERDYVMYNNELYICNTDIDTPEDFDNTKWDKTNILSIIPEFSVDENGTISTEKGQTISPSQVVGGNFAKGIIIKDENEINQCYDFRNVYFAELIPRPNDQQNPFMVVFPNYRMMGSAFSEKEEHPSVIFCYQQNSQNPFVTIPKGNFSQSVGYRGAGGAIVIPGPSSEVNSYCSFDLGNLSESDITFNEYAVLIYNDDCPGIWTIHPFSNRSKVAVYDNTTSGLTATNVQDAIDEIVTNKMDSVNPVGTGSLSINRLSNSIVGSYSVAEGHDNTAVGYASHAEGSGTTAEGASSHAEGEGTIASADFGSHAEGLHTTASGSGAHAEGVSTIAFGVYSHAEGRGTITGSAYQHVSGKYNIEDYLDTYAEIIGNGTADNARSNGRTLDWHGNETLAGKLTLGGGPENGNDAVRLTDLGATIAPLFSSSSTYAIDDYVIYEGVLYKCTTAVATAGDFDSNDWSAVRIVTEMGSGGGGGSTTLAGLNDVSIVSATDGQVLTYDSANSKWKNAAGGGGSSTLSGLTDVTVTTATNGQALVYDSSTSKWVNDTIPAGATALTGLSDVTISSAADGQSLVYDANSSKWVNGAGGGGSSTLSGLNDVTITSATGGQVLTYDSANSKWVNLAPALPWVDIDTTLTAGSTSVTVQNAAITTSSAIFVLTPDGTEYNDITVTTGQAVITFDAQASNLAVKVRVS